MTDYISSLFTLAEAEDLWTVDDDTAEEDESEAQWAREKRVTAMLTEIARRMSLDLHSEGRAVLYTEEDREAQINVFDGVTLEQLTAFGDIATGITVSASSSYRDVTSIRMTINPGLEDATLS